MFAASVLNNMSGKLRDCFDLGAHHVEAALVEWSHTATKNSRYSHGSETASPRETPQSLLSATKREPHYV